MRPEPDGLAVTGLRFGLRIGFTPLSLRLLDRRGRPLLADNPADVDGLGRPFVPPLGFVREGRAAIRTTQSFKLGPEEHLYGLGEKFTRLDKAGSRLVSWTRDALGSTSERSHKNIPFLWSDRGWGLFVDGGARIDWDLGATSTQSFTVSVAGGTLDAYAFFGPAPARLLKRYTDLTGRAPVPPKWSFGLWVSSGGTYRTQAEIEALVDGLAGHDIPAGVVHVDPWWMRWRQYCDFRWNREAFPHPDSLIRKLHGLGLKLCLWEHPYISIESDLFELGKRKGYFLKRPDGGVYVIDYGLSLAPRPDGIVRRAGRADSWNARVAIIDLTNPEALAWFKDLHRPLLRQGVDVFKTDFGEDIPADAVFHDGTTGATRHNIYPLLYNQAVAEVTREERGYGLVWSRSGAAGSQRYPVAWSGDPAADWDSLAATVRGGLSAGPVRHPLLEPRHRRLPGEADARALHPLGPIRPALFAQPDARGRAERALGRSARKRSRSCAVSFGFGIGSSPTSTAWPAKPRRPGCPSCGPCRWPSPKIRMPGPTTSNSCSGRGCSSPRSWIRPGNGPSICRTAAGENGLIAARSEAVNPLIHELPRTQAANGSTTGPGRAMPRAGASS